MRSGRVSDLTINPDNDLFNLALDAALYFYH